MENDGRDWLVCSVIPGNNIFVGFAGGLGAGAWQKDHIQASLVFFCKSCASRGINTSQVWPCAFLAHPPNAGNYSDNKYFCACCGGVLQLPFILLFKISDTERKNNCNKLNTL